MADFCQQCSIETFGEDYRDLAGLGSGQKLEEGYGWQVLCEGCGLALVDENGRCISHHCDKEHRKK